MDTEKILVEQSRKANLVREKGDDDLNTGSEQVPVGQAWKDAAQ